MTQKNRNNEWQDLYVCFPLDGREGSFIHLKARQWEPSTSDAGIPFSRVFTDAAFTLGNTNPATNEILRNWACRIAEHLGSPEKSYQLFFTKPQQGAWSRDSGTLAITVAHQRWQYGLPDNCRRICISAVLLDDLEVGSVGQDGFVEKLRFLVSAIPRLPAGKKPEQFIYSAEQLQGMGTDKALEANELLRQLRDLLGDELVRAVGHLDELRDLWGNGKQQDESPKLSGRSYLPYGIVLMSLTAMLWGSWDEEWEWMWPPGVTLVNVIPEKELPSALEVEPELKSGVVIEQKLQIEQGKVQKPILKPKPETKRQRMQKPESVSLENKKPAPVPQSETGLPAGSRLMEEGCVAAGSYDELLEGVAAIKARTNWILRFQGGADVDRINRYHSKLNNGQSVQQAEERLYQRISGEAPALIALPAEYRDGKVCVNVYKNG